MGRWGDGGMGDGEMGRWGDGETRIKITCYLLLSIPNAQLPITNDQLPMPNAQCPMPYPPFPISDW